MLLVRFVKQSLSAETYLKLCEQLGQEPDPEKMPLEASDFPEEVQVAFFMSSLLPDLYDTNAGVYLGKDWSSAAAILDIYEVQDKKTTVYLMKLYELVKIDHSVEKFNVEQEKSKRKAKSGDKKFTYNVSG